MSVTFSLLRLTPPLWINLRISPLDGKTLAFSVQRSRSLIPALIASRETSNWGTPIPGSLANIFREIHDDLGTPIPTSGNLDRWVAQGVFPMNSILTVRAYETGSHRNRGWETFTDSVIRKLSDEREHLVFMLWGAYAKEKSHLIDGTKHLILTASHPSPRSAEHGFFGCRHFSRANAYLRQYGIPEIVW